jgi:hypothetical protein
MISRFKASGVARQLFFVSPVTLGVARVGLALLLLFDLLRRWTDLDVWYTNAGLMPNHTMLWAPQSRRASRSSTRCHSCTRRASSCC